MRRAALLAALAAASTTGGCVAAAIPVAAGGVLAAGKADDYEKGVRGGRARAARAAQRDADKETRRAAKGLREGKITLPAKLGDNPAAGQVYQGNLPPPSGTPDVAVAGSPSSPSSASPVAETRQYLFGSGEAAALSVQSYQALTNYLATIKYRRRDTLRQAVLDEGSTLAKPYFEPCGAKPLAIVLDIDETALLNIGYEGDAQRRALGFDDARWRRWEASGANDVGAVPGAKAALDDARKADITVIFNSNRSAENAAQTAAALDHAGLGPAVHKTTLWLKGDDGVGGSGKDVRRWAITSNYCVVALVGDQLGDFSDLFNDPALTASARRAAAQSAAIAPLWGNGWFLLPNPVYGPALKGGYDDLFPGATRWTDPGAAAK